MADTATAADAEAWLAPHDPNLFLGAVVSSATVCAMIVFIAIKGRGRSGYPIFKEKSVGAILLPFRCIFCSLFAHFLLTLLVRPDDRAHAGGLGLDVVEHGGGGAPQAQLAGLDARLRLLALRVLGALEPDLPRLGPVDGLRLHAQL